MKFLRRSPIVAIIVTMALCLGIAVAYALQLDSQFRNIELRDAENNPTMIPLLGTKLVSIFYNDADAADLNDPLVRCVKGKEFPKRKV